jgi:tRNA nucleotidyltransferase (CCA-adding enzyme)
LNTLKVLQKLDAETRANVYLVGGFVRDFLRGEPNYDLDVVVRSLSIKSVQTFLKDFGKTKFVKLSNAGNSFDVGILLFQAHNDEMIAQIKSPARGKKQTEDPTNTLRQDAAHRDFTINGMYMPINASRRNEIIDLVGGKRDLMAKKIVAIGDAGDRLTEHPTRIMRAISVAARTGFSLDENLLFALSKHANLLRNVNSDNIRSELNHILLSNKPSKYFKLMHTLGLLKFVMPELDTCVGVYQEKKYHKWDVFHHCIYTCDNTEPDLVLRLAGLLHDIGKPSTKDRHPAKGITFHKHEMMSVNLAKTLLTNLGYDNETKKKILTLVRHHMYHYTRDYSDGAIRRFINKIGITAENIKDLSNFPLFKLRSAERLGNGFKKIPVTDKQRDFEARIIQVFNETTALKEENLDIAGKDLMRIFNLGQSPVIGQIKKYLLEKVIDNQKLNTRVELVKLAAAWLLENQKH